MEDIAVISPASLDQRYPSVTDTVHGSDVSWSGNSSSRACSTPASETSESVQFEQFSSQDVAPCKFPISHVDVQSVSLRRSVDVSLENQALYLLCRRYSLTPATVFKVAWLLLLHAYTGQDSVCFDLLSSSDMSTSLCRFDLTSDQTIAHILGSLEQDHIHSVSQRDVSFAETLQKFSFEKEWISNTAICIQNDQAKLSARQLKRYDILLELRRSDIDVSVALNYKQSAITQTYAERISATFETILQSILESPQQPRSSIEKLSLQDKQQILEWNSNTSPILDQCLHHVFIEKALDNPDSLAISAWDGELTYGELDEVSTQLAGHLDSLIKPGQKGMAIIPLAFEKSKFAIITMLAILKTGSACMPLDASAPRHELQQRLLDVAPQVICTSPSKAEKFADFGGHTVIVMPSLLESLRHRRCSFEPSDRRGDCAFVQYTTGTAGEPKGVLQSHAALYTGILALGEALGYDENARVMQHTPYTDFACVGDIFGAFFFDACLVVISEEHINGDLTGTINNEEITHACLTPSVARSLRLEVLFQLESLVLNGEPLESRDVEAWSYATELVKAYGTAETSVLCTMSKSPSPNVFMPSNIGRALTATSTWIVDPQDINKILPIGCVGELVVSGPALASGYLNDDAATTNAFITDPCWADADSCTSQQQFFRTGDLVKYLDTGELVLCGRTQGKLMGMSKDHD